MLGLADTVTKTPPAPETLIPSQRARRGRIVAAGLSLLEQGEYDKIQMRDVAEEAGVSLGTVYRYFASKEHLFAAVIVVWSDSLKVRVQRRPLVGDGPSEMLDDLMGRVLTAFERMPQFIRLIVILESTPDRHARATYTEFSEHTTGTFHQALESLDPDEASAVLDVVKAVLWTTLRQWSLGGITMKQARQRMSRGIGVIFSPPPKARSRRKA